MNVLERIDRAIAYAESLTIEPSLDPLAKQLVAEAVCSLQKVWLIQSQQSAAKKEGQS